MACSVCSAENHNKANCPDKYRCGECNKKGHNRQPVLRDDVAKPVRDQVTILEIVQKDKVRRQAKTYFGFGCGFPPRFRSIVRHLAP